MSESIAVNMPSNLDRIENFQELFYHQGDHQQVWDRWSRHMIQEPVTRSRVQSLAPELMKLIRAFCIMF